MLSGQRYASSLLICCLLIWTIPLAASVPLLPSDDEDSIWTSDAESAMARAHAENKDLLLLFTGSDWCPPCIKLEEQVFSKPEFGPGVEQDFVLVKFDFPQNSQLPQELEKQNVKWSDRYGIEGFPTVVLIDNTARPYAFTGFRDEGPAEYITHLTELQQARKSRDEALSKAESATGTERAKLLDEALSAMDNNIVQVYYTDLVEEIGELDAGDEAGLRTKYFAQRDREIRQAVMSNISMVSRLRKPAEAIEFIDATLAENKLPVEMWLIAQQTKLRLLRKLDEIDQANELVNQMMDAVDVDSETRQRLVNNKAYYLASLNRHDDAFAELKSQIAGHPDNLLMTIAVGDLHDSLGQGNEALQAYDRAIVAAAARPDILLEVIEAKADVLFELQKPDEAIGVLDSLIDNQDVPVSMRAQALLHKALFLRETGRRRAAILSENRAVELVESAGEKAEIQKLVDQFRRRFESGDSGD